MTKLGIGTYAFAWAIGVRHYDPPDSPMDYIGFIDRAAELGVSVAQIADNLPLDKLTIEQQTQLLQHADDKGIAIEVGARGIQLDYLRTYLDIAHRLRSPFLRVVVDSANHHPDPPEIIDIISKVKPKLEDYGIVLAIENHDRFRADELVSILQHFDDGTVGVCLDTVNSFGSLEGPEVVVEKLGPYVVNLHVKDFWIRRIDHNMGFILTGTPAGEGMLDMPWLLARLQNFGREFNAILEQWPSPEQTMQETIAKEGAWAKSGIKNLRKYIKD